MAGTKFYAMVFSNGTLQILEAAWEKVQPLVNGVSGVKYKGFASKEAAEEWATKTKSEVHQASKTKAQVKEIRKKNDVSYSEWMMTQVNTPHWNAIRRNKKRISES